MSEHSTQPTEHKESFFEKIFDHHHKHEDEEHDKDNDKDQPHHGGGLGSDMKKDEEGFRDYIKEDEEESKGGQEYGGLM
ncbi:hypothetical protein N7520_001831 [Penicillium odoratum]|uniref:uncharacterized protein n=1 Tax=Penicillium odoratum TaxID=1167516 RepID=UPI0025467E25|nr:uncharacterized protein N7520_001831 [Penicillium odoratum]KAJ5778585.1 hypothetical protein N7520_001831 [Penicillium odoratum]